MTVTLERWPLGDPSPTTTPHPRGGTRQCPQVVALLGDWHDAARGRGAHYAQDIFAPRGTPVLAPVSGRVRFAGWGEVGGWQVSIATRGGRVQLSHLDRAPDVATNDHVDAGQLVGVVGNTGNRASRTCPHLHVGAKDGTGEPVNIYADLRRLAPATRVTPGPDPDGPVRLPRPNVAPTGVLAAGLGLWALYEAAKKASAT